MSMDEINKREVLLKLASTRGVIRAEDIITLGISAGYLHDLARAGHLVHLGRGMFAQPDYPFTEHHNLVEAAQYAKGAVICLLSALRFHNLGTQSPHAVWLAIGNKARVPKVPTVVIEPVRMSPASLASGVETHLLEGIPVRIFSAPKTVADCFKFRSSVGLDVAIEALKDGLDRKLFQPSDLYELAMTIRIWSVIRPYLEALQ